MQVVKHVLSVKVVNKPYVVICKFVPMYIVSLGTMPINMLNVAVVSSFRLMDDDVQIEVKSYIGNLHSREVYQRYKMAGASFLVLSIIASGVPLYLLDTQIKKFPRGRNNNQSALAQSDFVDTTLLDWERQGFIKQIPLSEAKAVLPLSVAHRWSHSKKTLKHRLVLDCSPLSGKLSYGRIKLPDLNYLRHQIQKDDFIGLIDISITTF